MRFDVFSTKRTSNKWEYEIFNRPFLAKLKKNLKGHFPSLRSNFVLHIIYFSVLKAMVPTTKWKEEARTHAEQISLDLHSDIFFHLAAAPRWRILFGCNVTTYEQFYWVFSTTVGGCFNVNLVEGWLVDFPLGLCLFAIILDSGLKLLRTKEPGMWRKVKIEGVCKYWGGPLLQVTT